MESSEESLRSSSMPLLGQLQNTQRQDLLEGSPRDEEASEEGAIGNNPHPAHPPGFDLLHIARAGHPSCLDNACSCHLRSRDISVKQRAGHEHIEGTPYASVTSSLPKSRANHRRSSSRISSLIAIASPLGPGFRKNDRDSDVSGLLSPALGSCRPRSWQPESAAPKSSVQSGLHKKEVDVDSRTSPFLTPVSFGHSRKQTDPFVAFEDTKKWYKSAPPSPRTLQAPQQFVLRSPAWIHETTTPTSQRFVDIPSWTSLPSSPSRHDSLEADERTLPIPPPPLPLPSGKCVHTPGVRARLDAQKSIRADWIRTEARKMAESARASHEAMQVFQQTRSKGDYTTWQRAEATFKRATDSTRLQEERRNMFLPNGMVALRTDYIEDGSLSYSVVDGGTTRKGSDAGPLLGYHMAWMERICAEIQHGRQRDFDAMEHVAAEMVASLGRAEKRALREHVVARLRSDKMRIRDTDRS